MPKIVGLSMYHEFSNFICSGIEFHKMFGQSSVKLSSSSVTGLCNLIANCNINLVLNLVYLSNVKIFSIKLGFKLSVLNVFTNTVLIYLTF